jgi:hypothetical protein
MKSIHFSNAKSNTHLELGRNIVVFESYYIGFLECEWRVIPKPEPSIAFDLEVVEWAHGHRAMLARTYDQRHHRIYTVHITHIKDYGIQASNGARVLLPLRYWDMTPIGEQTVIGEQPQSGARHR